LEIKEGSLGFGPNSFKGVLGVVRKSKGGQLFSCFIAFLFDNFSDLTPLPPGPVVHLCFSTEITSFEKKPNKFEETPKDTSVYL
jgi:hypothetical protein